MKRFLAFLLIAFTALAGEWPTSVQWRTNMFENFSGSEGFWLDSSTTPNKGNARGAGAVDLQIGRNAAAKVASGQSSFAAGTNNTASGQYSFSAGIGNTASAQGAVSLGGYTSAPNTSSGNASFSAGYGNTASASGATAIGEYCTASGAHSTALGSYGTTSADDSFGSGSYFKSYLKGQSSHASGPFVSTAGEAQTSTLIARRSFTAAGAGNTVATNNWGELGLAGDAASLTRLVLPASTTWAFRGIVSAHGTGGSGLSAGYTFEGVIERDASNNTALVGSVTVTVLAEDDATWDFRVTADDTNEALKLEFFTVDDLARVVAAVWLTECGGT